MEDLYLVFVILILLCFLVVYLCEFGLSFLFVFLIDIFFLDVYYFCEFVFFLSDLLKFMFFKIVLRELMKEKLKCGNGVFMIRF